MSESVSDPFPSKGQAGADPNSNTGATPDRFPIQRDRPWLPPARSDQRTRTSSSSPPPKPVRSPADRCAMTGLGASGPLP